MSNQEINKGIEGSKLYSNYLSYNKPVCVVGKPVALFFFNMGHPENSISGHQIFLIYTTVDRRCPCS